MEVHEVPYQGKHGVGVARTSIVPPSIRWEKNLGWCWWGVDRELEPVDPEYLPSLFIPTRRIDKVLPTFLWPAGTDGLMAPTARLVLIDETEIDVYESLASVRAVLRREAVRPAVLMDTWPK